MNKSLLGPARMEHGSPLQDLGAYMQRDRRTIQSRDVSPWDVDMEGDEERLSGVITGAEGPLLQPDIEQDDVGVLEMNAQCDGIYDIAEPGQFEPLGPSQWLAPSDRDKEGHDATRLYDAFGPVSFPEDRLLPNSCDDMNTMPFSHVDPVESQLDIEHAGTSDLWPPDGTEKAVHYSPSSAGGWPVADGFPAFSISQHDSGDLSANATHLSTDTDDPLSRVVQSERNTCYSAFGMGSASEHTADLSPGTSGLDDDSAALLASRGYARLMDPAVDSPNDDVIHAPFPYKISPQSKGLAAEMLIDAGMTVLLTPRAYAVRTDPAVGSSTSISASLFPRIGSQSTGSSAEMSVDTDVDMAALLAPQAYAQRMDLAVGSSTSMSASLSPRIGSQSTGSSAEMSVDTDVDMAALLTPQAYAQRMDLAVGSSTSMSASLSPRIGSQSSGSSAEMSVDTDVDMAALLAPQAYAQRMDLAAGLSSYTPTSLLPQIGTQWTALTVERLLDTDIAALLSPRAYAQLIGLTAGSLIDNASLRPQIGPQSARSTAEMLPDPDMAALLAPRASAELMDLNVCSPIDGDTLASLHPKIDAQSRDSTVETLTDTGMAALMAPQVYAQPMNPTVGRLSDSNMVTLSTRRVDAENLELERENSVSVSQPAFYPLTAVRTHRQGYPWRDNSCWLDTSLELIFQTVQRDWNSFSRCLPHPAHPVYEAINQRRSVGLSRHPGDIATVLSAQRDALRKTLVERGLIRSMNSCEPAFGWLDGLLRPQTSGKQDDVQPYFQGYSVTLRSCSGVPGRSDTYQHHQIKAPRPRFYYQLKDQDYRKCGGSASSWFHRLLDTSCRPEPERDCWRVRNDSLYCKGQAQLAELHFVLPIMLVIEVGTATGKIWDFPSFLRPPHYKEECGPHSDDLPGPQYDLVGRIFYEPARHHFFCRFVSSSRQSHVIEYDGLAAKGIKQYVSSGGVDDLAGLYDSPTHGYHTHSAVYHLRGGTRAQEGFLSHQKSSIERHHSLQILRGTPHLLPQITLQKPGFITVPDRDRFWLHNPSRGGTYEYDAQVSSKGLRTVISPANRAEEPQGVTEDSDKIGHSGVSMVESTAYTAMQNSDTQDNPTSLDDTQAIRAGPPDFTALVPETELVDELWGDRDARRSIRLGRWKLACRVEDDEDLLLNPTSFPFSAEIDQILTPHCGVLATLIDVSSCGPGFDLRAIDLDIPALNAVRDARGGGRGTAALKSGVIADRGGLSVMDYGQIINWIYNKVPRAQDKIHVWLGCIPTGHATTLVLLARNKHLFLQHPGFASLHTDAGGHRFLVQKAWEYQQNTVESETHDVDRECVSLFERRLFESSTEAGPASYEQWGLDAGDHQGKWYPYGEVPSDWGEDGLSMSDSELERGPDFSMGEEDADTLARKLTELRPRPKPRRRIRPPIATK
ncbi:uncharacterized protein B0H18DRAFT_1118160 [Fomitopsis serialis]|uniref:uncharacterized protein n=1 Tax=Fomitopsis serialis TaxID=139415 RepID=UPI00200793F1|nr:uncharacterized protein B0H18DRAFT_1118160 [Neoantrodia serialis]KAH9928142.1 hypothetical protein B0H18DRAFT_1118160 [Neoantrodia serialis]